MIIIGLLSVVSGLSCIFLPETMGIPLPETVAEAEMTASGVVSFATAAGHWERIFGRKKEEQEDGTVVLFENRRAEPPAEV